MKAQEKQQKRIQGLYRRLIRVPLLNADYQHLMEEAAEFFEGDFDVHMKADLEKTKQKLNEKIPFEEKLVFILWFCFLLSVLGISINHSLHSTSFPANCSFIITHVVLNRDLFLYQE